ncbi:hypothetical protein FY557_14250 [Chryseobacterium sp. SN22]|uniref:hypothetical protein n=1 Tax=Chryseobacterium sp. SN22 TaxID=2606431 RepID=UPI0011EF7BE9|nr:hypothetical protein [Chryseobacterium sp. SN22]KAA0127146.1 hypothetical protein FY557_14250 [Chryseobacterium sp. SN22]
MKTIKSNIEQQIKKQIEEREITPSRDLWSEIESQAVAKTSKPSFNWLLIAACFILTFSLGAVLFFNRENKPYGSSETIVHTITEPAIQNPLGHIAQEQDAEPAAKNHEEKTVAENISAGIKTEERNREPQAFAQQEEMPVIIRNSVQIISELSPIQPGKTIAQTDSAKVPVKKKRYVDPSTLLFSVEHKDVIEKTKGKSNVATIDLNKN